MFGAVGYEQVLHLLLWAHCSHCLRIKLMLQGQLPFALGKMGHVFESHRESTGKQKTEINSLKSGASTTIKNLFCSLLLALSSGACSVKSPEVSVLPKAGMRQCNGSLPAALAMIELLVLACMFIYTPRKLFLHLLQLYILHQITKP